MSKTSHRVNIQLFILIWKQKSPVVLKKPHSERRMVVRVKIGDIFRFKKSMTEIQIEISNFSLEPSLEGHFAHVIQNHLMISNNTWAYCKKIFIDCVVK